MTETIDPARWEWFGMAAHLCVGQWCRFHMATVVGDFLVSTVGQYVPPSAGNSERGEAEFLERHPNGETIGSDRCYETMVFLAGPRCELDGCKCGMPEIGGEELWMDGYNTVGEATRGHLNACARVARGEIGGVE